MNLNVGNYSFGIRQPVKADKKAKVDDELANQDGTLPKKGATIDPDYVPDSMKGLTGSEILSNYIRGSQLANVDGSLPEDDTVQETCTIKGKTADNKNISITVKAFCFVEPSFFHVEYDKQIEGKGTESVVRTIPGYTKTECTYDAALQVAKNDGDLSLYELTWCESD